MCATDALVTPPSRRGPAPAMRGLALLALACLPALAAAQLQADARQEIDALLRAVGSSGCEFLRGGSSYNAAKAQDHLQQKFEYLDARSQLKSAEDFILKAGTRSSMTGESYSIRCASTGVLASDAWLHAKLRALRSPRAPAPAPAPLPKC